MLIGVTLVISCDVKLKLVEVDKHKINYIPY